jgi:hypothetical protein
MTGNNREEAIGAAFGQSPKPRDNMERGFLWSGDCSCCGRTNAAAGDQIIDGQLASVHLERPDLERRIRYVD